MATLDDSGQVVVLPNASGGEITPSVVYFEPDGSVVVGEDAVQATAVDPDNGVLLIKRVMGTDFPIRVRGQRAHSRVDLRADPAAAHQAAVGHEASR